MQRSVISLSDGWALEDLLSPLWQIPTPQGVIIFLSGKGNIIPLLQDKEMQIRAELMFPKFRELIQLNDCFVPYLQRQQGV